ncbi:isocitrate/isopropylmalate family dehydrogenase [Streptomyces sp. NPDC026672]|uniref:isocitrate/isopropylmalate family dehydrogenase n=1 Tax=unclassified Streptomyces TaxID=2593676 RepID=UPI0033EE5050
MSSTSHPASTTSPGPTAVPAPEHTVGLAVGRGTGPEVAAVFEQVLGRFAQLHDRHIRVDRSPRTYHSYVSLRDEGGGIEEIRRLTHGDADHYESFVRARAAAGTRVIFRTAINAQTLYLVRQRLQAVKVDTLDAAGARVLLVRDQAQGFYTGDNEHAPGQVRRVTEFRQDITEEVLHYALRRARREWPGEGPARIVMAYKFHLLDGALDVWATEFAARHGVEVQVFQPDTVNRNLITHGPADRTVLVAGNEWADIMHVVLLDRFGAGRQEDHCTLNVHLHPDVRGLVEYQTVHGSADDLEGRDLVNPVATVRAAAAVAERHAGCGGAIAAAEAALARIREAGVRTPDLGGRHSTSEVVKALLDALEPTVGPVALEQCVDPVALEQPVVPADLEQPVVPADLESPMDRADLEQPESPVPHSVVRAPVAVPTSGRP